MPKVSVIMPAYNAMAYLPEAIASVLNQSFSDFEVLVVNDGSTDGIIEWMSQLSDPRVRLISQENQGLSGARNTGINWAQGEYLAFIDADDLWEPTKLEKQVNILDQNPKVGLVYTWVDYVDEMGRSQGRVRQAFAEGDVWAQMVESNFISCASVPLVRRSCFETVGLFDRELRTTQDRDMWIRITAHYPVALIQEPLVRYRQHTNSMSTKGCKQKEKDFQRIMEKTFRSAPPELMGLKRRAYGLEYLYFAWKSLENMNYEDVAYYSQQALHYNPRLIVSKNYLRLSAIVMAKRWFGNQGYHRLRSLVSLKK